MKIAITGASGFIGSHLSLHLHQAGHEVLPLGRAELAPGAEAALELRVADCDAVVNLAGAPINKRWTTAYKEELVRSRVDVTRRLVAAINHSASVKVLVSTSAVGYYPSVGCYDETAQVRGEGFLARLCEMWEAEARAVNPGVRLVITRFGVVLSTDGGAFPRMALPARLGVAGVAGGGHQPFSWIDLEDLVRAVEMLIEKESLSGVFNLASPQKLTQREFVHAIAVHYGAWFTLCVPAFFFRMVYGQGAEFMLLGQCAVPARLLAAGFRFRSPQVGDFFGRL